MNGQDKVNITLNIYDTSIPMSAPRDQEELYRQAGQLINEKLNAYNGVFKGKKSEKEICYFALIDIALRCVTEEKRNDVIPYTDMLEKLSTEIDKAIS